VIAPAARWRRRALAAGALLAAAPLVAWVIWAAVVRAGSFPRARLEPRAAASVTVLDREGTILRQRVAEVGGRERWVPLARISPHLVSATLAAEDHRFWSHGGVDAWGVLRALWLDLRAGRLAYGGSTITMQLVRLLDPGPRPRGLRALGAKLREAVAAARLERVAAKDEILEQYLNRAYYGRGAWGAEQAAQTYLGKPAAALSIGEAAFLAVLPRGPAVYDPYRALPRVLARRRHLLGQMVRRQGLAPEARDLAERTPVALRRERPGFGAPHFVDEALARAGAAAARGATVATTLDGPLQTRLEVAVREHLAAVGGRRVDQAGLVVLRNEDGAVLALVGSRDYFDAAHAGAANVVTLRRRPGSTLKPFVYALALEAGDTPATIAMDVVLPGEARAPYTADVRQRGVARYREALAGSYNLAAVHTLARVGVPELLARLRAAGLGTLDRPDDAYDLGLAIGHGEVRLLDLTAAFAAFGNEGRPVRPRFVEGITPAGGSFARAPMAPAPPPFTSPEIAYLLFDILSDPDARRPMFGLAAPMVLPFPVALKTGTTRAYTDNLAIGTTREYTVGAWAGNFDGKPTAGLMAMHGAAPLVRAAFVALAARFGPPRAPERPAGLVEGEVCALSGARPGPACPTRKRDLFVAGTLPDATCTWHRRRCGRVETVYPEEARPWARARGLLDGPACAEAAGGDAGPLRILSPQTGARFELDPDRPAARQAPPLRASWAGRGLRWTIDGLPADRWTPGPGRHVARVEAGGASAESEFWFE
jgi:penicillin-binding protein 1C